MIDSSPAAIGPSRDPAVGPASTDRSLGIEDRFVAGTNAWLPRVNRRLRGMQNPVMTMLRRLPLMLTLLRAMLAPVMVMLAFMWPSHVAFGICLVMAFLSDVFDGVVARRLGIATASLRRLDSIADTLFYAGALYAAWHLQPLALLDHKTALVILVLLEVTRYVFDLRKFGREASYHMWSSKLWGLALFAGFFSLLALGRSGGAVAAAIWLGIVADIEGLAISAVLTRWTHDVPSIVHAMRLRRHAP